MNLSIFPLCGCALFIMLLQGCTPDPGPGGQSTISGTVAHHNDPIAGAIVYIAYGATAFPGENRAAYDDQTVATSAGEYSFENLEKGDYYLWSAGWDTQFNDSVFGGVPTTIEKGGDTVNRDVPVTE